MNSNQPTATALDDSEVIMSEQSATFAAHAQGEEFSPADSHLVTMSSAVAWIRRKLGDDEGGSYQLTRKASDVLVIDFFNEVGVNNYRLTIEGSAVQLDGVTDAC